MSREEYLKLRENNSVELLYEYYKEKVDTVKYKLFQPDEFFQYITQWPFVHEAFQTVVSYFDAQFVVMKVQDLSTGDTIKIY